MDGDAWGALMARAQDGDRAAYRRLLAEVSPWLRAMAAKRLAPADVEDAVQEALVTLHRARHTYDPSRPFRPWLATLALRRIADAGRRTRRSGAREVPLAPEHAGVAAEEAAGDAGGGLDGRVLAAAIGRLPPGQRDAVELLKLREMTLREASAATGLSVTALKVASHRGVKRLRRLLEGG